MNPPEYIPLDDDPRPGNLARQASLRPVCKCATVPTLILTSLVIIVSGAIIGLSLGVRTETEFSPDPEDLEPILPNTTTQNPVKSRGDQSPGESNEDSELQETQWHRVPGAIRRKREAREIHVNRTWYRECANWVKYNPTRLQELEQGEPPRSTLEAMCHTYHHDGVLATLPT